METVEIKTLNDIVDVEEPVVEIKKNGSFELTEEQKQKILDAWNNASKTSPPSLKDLVVAALGTEFDGRSLEAKSVKSFLASRDIKAKPSYIYESKTGSILLSEANKEFIYNNFLAMNALEMSKTIFNKQNLTAMSAECRIVQAYIKTLPSNRAGTESEALDKWKPPKTQEQAIFRVNKYVLNGLNKDKLTPKQNRDIESMIRFLHTLRLNIILNNYSDGQDRDLFESSFVRFTYDKNDLTEEEVDQYISVCNDIVNHTKMQREVDNLASIRDAISEDPDGRLSMSIVEALGGLYGEMDNNLKRQQKSLESLNGKRDERMKNKVKEHQSLVTLVEAWKQKEQRDKMIRLSLLKRKIREKAVDELESMEGVKASVFGITREELLLDEV
jgi:hypothetical protein